MSKSILIFECAHSKINIDFEKFKVLKPESIFPHRKLENVRYQREGVILFYYTSVEVNWQLYARN